MRISLARLRDYVDLPADDSLRALFDDVGLEVKRAQVDDGGLRFTLELLANRGDHRCYAGVARELYARVATRLRLPSPIPVDVEGGRVRVESPRCGTYTLTELVRTGPDAPLDPTALEILAAAGLNPVSPPVDATNFVNLELGQPTHAFDADTIVGGVCVRESVAGERAWLLFTPGPVDVPAGTLVIADDVKILAIAGVIGCEESKTTASTRRIWLESAYFDSVAVRIAARALGTQTDASARFERGADPAAALTGAARVVELLERTGAWRRHGPTAVEGEWADPRRRIVLPLDAASRFLGRPVDASTASGILRRYGFAVEPIAGGFLVTVPTWRLPDVVHVADLYEELAKAIGYDALPSVLPPVDAGALPSAAELRRERVEEVLLGQGYFELVTNGFYGRALLDLGGIGDGHPLAAHVETTNALDRGYTYLKNNALLQAIEAVALNVRVKNPEVRAFEWTRTFHPTGATDATGRQASPAHERHVLWTIATGPLHPAHWSGRAGPVDLWYLKGLVDAIAGELVLPLRVDASDRAAPLATLLHPHRQARVTLHGRTVGILGEVHPSLCARLKLRNLLPMYLELDTQALLHEPTARWPYEEPPAMPPMDRQLTLTVPDGVEAARVEAAMRAEGLEGVEVVDRFVLDGAAALTWTLHFTASRTRTADDVNAALTQLVAAVEAAVPGVRLRA